jgi:hypothetical protein
VVEGEWAFVSVLMVERFLVLQDNTSSLGPTYDATQTNDLHAIYSAFYQAKLIVEENARGRDFFETTLIRVTMPRFHQK